MHYKKLFFLLIFISLTGLPVRAQKKAEIKWDKWGVPHIYASNRTDMMYAFGWAQMKAHANMVLRLYGESRGKAAEYWGKSKLKNDRLVRSLDIPNRAKRWYKHQSKTQQTQIAAFAEGMNAFAKAHPQAIAKKYQQVLPIEKEDPLRVLQTIYHLKVAAFALQPQAAQWKNAGSNAWAIAPKKSASGNAMLLIQPHPPWFDYYIFTEAHLVAPGINIYGMASVGMPGIVMGFNEHLGWAYTFSRADAMDLYNLNTEGNAYHYEGKLKPFKTHEETIAVRQKDGSLKYEKLTVKQSVQGYVIEEKADKALAIRISGLDRPFMLEQHWQMAAAQNRKQFEKAVSRLQLPLQHIIYADRHGEIFYLYNGILPKRKINNYKYWQKIQDGSKAVNTVQDYLKYRELPKFSNPVSGFIANSNNSPWTSTFPQVIKASQYPEYIAPQNRRLDFRGQGSAKRLLNHKKISFEQLVNFQGSTRSEMADKYLSELLKYAKSQKNNALLQEAYQVLKTWDRQMRPQSKGAVLFAHWDRLVKWKDFENTWSADKPLETPAKLKKQGLTKLIIAAQQVKKKYGRLDVPWGNVYRIQYAGKDLPAHLGLPELGAFNSGFFRPAPKHQKVLLGGCSFIGAVEFGKKVKAKGLLTYGNSSQKHSKHYGDQLELFSQGKLRDIYFYKKDVVQHTMTTEKLK